MKKIIVISVLCIVTIFIIIGINLRNNNNKFYLEDKYYETNELKEIDVKELENIVDNKESFGIFVYQPMCVTSSNLSKILDEYQSRYNISFYKIAFSDIKDIDKFSYLKYYPSFIIYNEGKMIDYLDANSDDDKMYYKDLDKFQEWINQYIKIKKDSNIESSNKNNSGNNKEQKEIKKVLLDDVKYDDHKINIYFFWGDGCPHCEEEFKFFERIEKKYGKYYKLHTFEVWKNKENIKILEAFSSAMDEEVTGVPYTIIGKSSFIGFDNSDEDDLIQEIISQHKNSYDVYFEKINKD